MAFGSMRPDPIVLATAVPERAPTKFRIAAMRIACQGARTRVAMTVAIAFAVSWKPLMKSKITAATRTRMRIAPRSPMLDGDAFELVRDVLHAVRAVLEVLVDLLPARHLEPVVTLVEQVAERLARDAVGVVLVPVHLDDVFPDLREGAAVAQPRDRGVDLDGALRDDPAEVDALRRDALDLPEHELVRRGL